MVDGVTVDEKDAISLAHRVATCAKLRTIQEQADALVELVQRRVGLSLIPLLETVLPERADRVLQGH